MINTKKLVEKVGIIGLQDIIAEHDPNIINYLSIIDNFNINLFTLYEKGDDATKDLIATTMLAQTRILVIVILELMKEKEKMRVEHVNYN